MAGLNIEGDLSFLPWTVVIRVFGDVYNLSDLVGIAGELFRLYPSNFVFEFEEVVVGDPPAPVPFTTNGGGEIAMFSFSIDRKLVVKLVIGMNEDKHCAVSTLYFND